MPSFALRNPYMIIVGALAITILGVTAFTRMPVDVFPDIKIPSVVVATFYQGMPPLDMEDNITFRYERFFTLGSNIDHIESRSLAGVSIIKVYFQPGTNVATAAAQMGTLAMADLGIMPPGTLPPLVLQYDASSLPVVLVTLEGAGYSETQLEDQARYNVRNQLATVAGASVPIPFGGKFRQIMAYVNREALQARGMSLMDVVNAIDQSNLILPAGDAKIGTTDYYIYSNSMVPKIDEINSVPVKVGRGQAPVLLGDVGKVEDSSQIQYNKVLINGHPSVYVPFCARPAPTPSQWLMASRICSQVFGLPPGMSLKTIFDQSIYVRQAVTSLAHEAVSGSILASLMILIFLGSFRSTLAIFLSIPLSILAGAFGLFIERLDDQHHDPGRIRAGHRPPGRRFGGRAGKHQSASGRGRGSRAGGARWRRRGGAAGVGLNAHHLHSFLPGHVPVRGGEISVQRAGAGGGAVDDGIVRRGDERYPDLLRALSHHRGCARGWKPERAKGVLAAFNRVLRTIRAPVRTSAGAPLNHKLIVVIARQRALLRQPDDLSAAWHGAVSRDRRGHFHDQFPGAGGNPAGADRRAMARQIEKVIRQVIPPSDLDMVVSNLGLAPSISAIYSPNSSEDSAFMESSLRTATASRPLSTWNASKRAAARKFPERGPSLPPAASSMRCSILAWQAPIDVQLSGSATSKRCLPPRAKRRT